MVIATKKKFPAFHLVKYQCLAAVSANIIVFCHGLTVGWCAPSLWLMLSEDSPLSSGKISLNDASWIGSSMYLGSIGGNLLFSLVTKYFGLKIALGLLAVPNLAAWSVVLCANYPFEVVISRVVNGICSGGALLCVPLFIAEISNKHIRGILGSLFMIIFNMGMLFAMIVVSYVPYNVTPYIFMTPGIIYTCCLILLPESPQSLLLANKPQKAEKSFRFYNFGNDQTTEMTSDVKLEYEELCSSIESRKENDKNDNTTCRTFLTDIETLKGLSVGMFLIALAVFSGIFSVNVYAISIFSETGTYIDAKISAITITLIQLIGSVVSAIFIDRLGRKKVLSISSIGAAVSLFGFATFTYLYKNGYQLTSLYWVPVTTMALFIFSNNVGIVSLPFVIVAELLPQETRRIGSAICFFLQSAFAFTNLKIFPILSEQLGLYTVMWMYSGVCLTEFFFAIFVLKETKGKTLHRNSEK